MDHKVVEWQFPVSENLLTGKGYIINEKSKIHCFVNAKSLCGKYYIVPECFETTDCGAVEAEKSPEYFCKQCLKKYRKRVEQCLL